ncbi:MAG: TIGR02266 family protein [Deltaproteobacteria bacterium]|nr:TIGR02266 family protein [Deltaproteobacteria bacterium]
MDERRVTPRYEVVLKVRYETDKAFQEAAIHNLSSGGLYLTTQTPFGVGSEFELEIELPERGEWIKGRCKVVWVNEIDTEQYPRGMGVVFLQRPAGYTELLENCQKSG